MPPAARAVRAVFADSPIAAAALKPLGGRLRHPRISISPRAKRCRNCGCTTPPSASRGATSTAASPTRCSSCTARAASGHSFLVDRFAGVLFGKGSCSTPTATTSSCRTASATAPRASRATDCTRAFRNTPMRTWSRAQHALLAQGLHVDHLRLVMGTSMGCMHTWLWTERYPAFMDAAMPLACLPVQIAGRNRVWRDLIIDSIRTDPQWLQGEYRSEPMEALRAAAGYLLIAGSAPIQMQIALPTREAADEFREGVHGPADRRARRQRSSVPDQRLARLRPLGRASTRSRRRVMWINSADDFVNPPELGIAEREVKKVKNGALRAAARLRSNPRARHAYLGRRVAAIPERAPDLERPCQSRRADAASTAEAASVLRGLGRRAAASISCISALRSPGGMARECPRGRSRDRCTGPKRTRISRLTMMPRAAHQ